MKKSCLLATLFLLNGYKNKGSDSMFKDFNFKLLVIEALLDKEPAFEQELAALKEQFTTQYEWYEDMKPIPQIMTYLQNLELSKKDLLKVDYLCFDGGNEIYHIIQPDWDGEDDLFDVTSVEGFEQLPNLMTVDYLSMAEPEVLEPLRAAGITVE